MLGSQLGIHRKLGLSPLRTVHETELGHLLRNDADINATRTSALLPHDNFAFLTAAGKYGCTEVRVSAANNLGEIPKKLGARNLLF